MTAHRIVGSPLGQLTLVVNDDGALTGLYNEGQAHFPELETMGVEDGTVAQEAVEQLGQYFAGSRQCFDLHLSPAGTDFQRAVWEHLRAIPFGETQTYGDLANALGKPTAARAVGAATGRNPLSIVVPCHRLVGASGSLTGYAGGVERKAWLLDHESHS